VFWKAARPAPPNFSGSSPPPTSLGTYNLLFRTPATSNHFSFPLRVRTLWGSTVIKLKVDTHHYVTSCHRNVKRSLTINHATKVFVFRYGSHLGNLCQNLFTLRWKSVIAGLCLLRPQVFRFGKNFANRQNIKDAVVLGWGRQIFEKSSQTMGITSVTVKACQRDMKNDTRGKFSSSSRSFIMNGRGYYYNPAQLVSRFSRFLRR